MSPRRGTARPRRAHCRRVSGKAEIGVTGLATMGRNLARNLARHGHVVALHNRTEQQDRRTCVDHFSDEGDFVARASRRRSSSTPSRSRGAS